VKFLWERGRVDDAFDLILARALRVKLHGNIKVCRDPNDDIFLECAVRARADLLVARDKDLLVLKTFEGIRIITPAAYVGLEQS
jgi:putative PIN family toxin of toxin-antitoxin system